MDTLHLAAQAVCVLDYTTEDITHLLDEKFNGKYDAVIENLEFLRNIDRVIFQCNFCSYWKPQRENGTPDAAQWTCKECVNDGV